MGCGCNKGRAAKMPQGANVTSSAEGIKSTARVAVYEVVKDGEVVLSTTSATAARSESKRQRASLRVTSRPVAPAEQAALTG